MVNFCYLISCEINILRNKVVSSNCRTCGWFSDLWCDNDINRNKVCLKKAVHVIDSMPGEFALTLKFDKSYGFQKTKRVFCSVFLFIKRNFSVISGLSITFCAISETFSFSNSLRYFKEKIR